MIVPRAKRRGLLARLAFVPEVERPYDYKSGTKWFITFQVAIAAAAAPIGSAILLRELGYLLVLFISPFEFLASMLAFECPSLSLDLWGSKSDVKPTIPLSSLFLAWD